MSYHVRRIALANWPIMLPPAIGNTERREASAQDLLNMGLVEIGRDAAHVYLDCCVLDADRLALLPGEQPPHASGYVGVRTARLPDDVRQRVLRAKVYRHRDPAQSLRHLVNDNTDPERLRAKVPATGKTSTQPLHLGKALAALEAARAMAGEVTELLVPMADVLDGDVVDEDTLAANRWNGEPDR